jgi:predicted membrane channel-forming protein YqfA (hemolysin III family)
MKPDSKMKPNSKMKPIDIFFKLLTHISLVLSLCFVVFIILDYYNPLMNFTQNTVSSKLLIALIVSTLLSQIYHVIRHISD